MNILRIILILMTAVFVDHASASDASAVCDKSKANNFHHSYGAKK